MHPNDFAAFYHAVHGHPPFPWQERLLASFLAHEWPSTLALPTASGKTSVLDVWAFALALQAGQPAAQRTLPLRLVFVIDRRLVVDAVTQHAEQLVYALTHDSGVSAEVARHLRRFGGEAPLAVTALRGGMYRDETWSTWPNQPTVVVSTVDQVGSRLLFRGYGLSPYQWPVHAGLVGHDVGYVVDEAHLSHPFIETLRSVRHYRQRWAQQPLGTPFHVLVMSATPPPSEQAFHLQADDVRHPVLRQRLQATKRARLLRAHDSTFPATVIREAQRLAASEGVHVVGIVVNRVETARRVFEALRREAEAVLLTGRIRPYDRDQLLQAWLPRIEAGRAPVPGPLYVVATQTIEVGANVDFDALVTEAAPLSALRQRFGRLDRLGWRKCSEAVIILRRTRHDPVYQGRAQAAFEWLEDHATREGQPATIDFGIQALDALLQTANPPPPVEDPHPAPVLLPTFLDLWVQTHPAPAPTPDVAPFLHGPQPQALDVYVVWRADLRAGQEPEWADIVALLPPRLPEALPVPIAAVRAWLSHQAPTVVSDVEGAPLDPAAADTGRSPRRVLRWRGEETTPEQDLIPARELRPGDTLVVPASWGGADAWGWHPEGTDPVADIAEACQQGRPRGGLSRLRVHPALLQQWLPQEAYENAHLRLQEVLKALADPGEDEGSSAQAALLGLEVLASVGAQWGRAQVDPMQMLPYPGAKPAGILLTTGSPAWLTDEDDTSLLTRPVPLAPHLEGVGAWSRHFAEGCGLPPEIGHDLELAGRWHDLGKMEPRFQILLHAGNPLAAATAPEPLAKSGMDPSHRAALRWAREQSGLPRGFRHEFVSVALLDANPQLLQEAHDAELVRYLVGVHHGRGRPFPPVVVDPDPQPCAGVYRGHPIEARSDHGLERVESGWVDLFWRLVRRYGYWGLAYLEALLRQADGARSRQEVDDG